MSTYCAAPDCIRPPTHVALIHDAWKGKSRTELVCTEHSKNELVKDAIAIPWETKGA